MIASAGVLVAAAGLPVFVLPCSTCGGSGQVLVFEEIDFGSSFIRVPAGEVPCPECSNSTEVSNGA